MAKFEPGHLHVERHALTPQDHSYDLKVDYTVDKDPSKGKGVRFTVHGQIQGKELKEEFFLPKEEAFNFTRDFSKIFEKYGVPRDQQIQVHVNNPIYDKMFEDIRAKLDHKSGDPVDIKDFE
ncbi:DUF5064 family protein [Pseudomonas akapageensis]|uniref:DUF5064 family protein n=1 Tax=Pseudomonas akapageensis TaxID=2609961 RepID=UPI001408C1BD|nr:DUF5064 family protein [Pseudomonas akapageensis]